MKFGLGGEVFPGNPLPQSTPASAGVRSRPRLGVGIATSGRPDALLGLMNSLALQERAPDAVCICGDGQGSFDHPVFAAPHVRILRGPRGLCAKRNRILVEALDAEVLVFFDDDFVPDASYLAAVERAFVEDPELVVLTGLVLADGVNGPEIGAAEAAALIGRHRAAARPAEKEAVYNAYGCNMAFRLDAIRARALQFDEALPLYGWLEDVDFSRRLADSGRIERHTAPFGVHRGVKAARLSSRGFGYSQVANSLYLVGKGTLGRWSSTNQIVRNVARNALMAVRPEPWCDRRGRLRGNALALFDLLRGRIDIGRISTL